MSCEACEERKPRNAKGPLRQHSDGNGPWDKIGTDIFTIENRNYLLTIDYYSNCIEVDHLSSLGSRQVIDKLKKLFSRFGVPRQVISDGGPQYTSEEFKRFVKCWRIDHHVTSPNHSQSNGKAESGVKIIKSMMAKCLRDGTDQNLALLELRNTPRKDMGKSLYEMMFTKPGRTLVPENVNQKYVKPARREARKQQVKKSYDKRARQLPKRLGFTHALYSALVH